jgi:branched-chain amino acid transport system ATP-binding protein
MLEVRNLHAYYGKSHVLQGVDFSIGDNEIVSILGRNGVGRSTTLKTIMGDPVPQGDIRFKTRAIAGLKPHEIARLGIGYVPEERAIFPNLTVAQNLLLGVKPGQTPKRWGFEETWRVFPRLRERADAPGGALSGGEQQMLTICRTLMGDPDLIMIDEPTEGLAPQMVELIGELLREIARRGISILLVEQRLVIALRIFEGTPATLMADAEVRREWLEV